MALQQPDQPPSHGPAVAVQWGNLGLARAGEGDDGRGVASDDFEHYYDFLAPPRLRGSVYGHKPAPRPRPAGWMYGMHVCMYLAAAVVVIGVQRWPSLS